MKNKKYEGKHFSKISENELNEIQFINEIFISLIYDEINKQPKSKIELR